MIQPLSNFYGLGRSRTAATEAYGPPSGVTWRLWFEAGLISGVSNGGNVGTWTDAILGRVATTFGSSHAGSFGYTPVPPTLVTSTAALGNKPSLSFTNTTPMKIGSLLTSSSEATIVAVLAPGSSPAGTDIRLMGSASGIAGVSVSSGVKGYLRFISGVLYVHDGVDWRQLGSAIDGSGKICSIRFQSSEVTHRRNSSVHGSSATPLTNDFSSGDWGIGLIHYGGVPPQMALAALGVIQGDPGSTALASVENQLKQRYAL